MLDTSRWWTMRWPTNAISLLSFSCGLDAEQTFKLFRALRLTMLNYVRELWFTLMDRRHAASNVYACAFLRIDWTRVQRMLGRTANRRGRVMPDWAGLYLIHQHHHHQEMPHHHIRVGVSCDRVEASSKHGRRSLVREPEDGREDAAHGASQEERDGLARARLGLVRA